MANVLFKRGLSTALPTVAQDGVFYLTTDTSRLYVGNGTSLEAINKNIVIVDNLVALENLTPVSTDDFAFVKDGNILAVCIDSTATKLSEKWVQLNPDTNTNDDTFVTDLKFETEVQTNEDGSSKSLLVKYTLTQATDNLLDNAEPVPVAKPIEGYFEIASADLSAIEIPVAVAVETTKVQDNLIKIKNYGVGAEGSGFEIAGEDGTTIVAGSTKTDKDYLEKIIIKSTTYNLTSPENSTNIILEGSDNTTPTVTLEEGSQIELDGTAEDKIIVSHASIDTDMTRPNKDDENYVPVALGHNDTLQVVKDLTTGANGHVTAYEVVEYTLPNAQDTTYTSKELKADDKGKITLELITYVDGKETAEEWKAISGNDLYYTLEGSETKYYNQAVLPVYTRSEIDQKLYGINALVYKGAIKNILVEGNRLPNSNSELTDATKKIAIGYTYIVTEAGTYGGYAAEVGDLFIATVSDTVTNPETDGVITDDVAIVWTYVPSGDDVDTTYDISLQDETITFTPSTDLNASIKVGFEAKTDIVLDTLSAGNNKPDRIAISHATYDSIDKIENIVNVDRSQTFTVLENVVTNNGHVTELQTKQVTVPDDSRYSLETTSENKEVIVTLEGTGNDNSTIVFNAYEDADDNQSLSVSLVNDKITYKHTDYNYTSPTTLATNSDTTLTAGSAFTILSEPVLSNGHVTSFNTATLTLPADNDTLSTLTQSVTSKDKGVEITTAVTESGGAHNGASSSGTIAVVSDTLSISSSDSSNCSIDIVWGTF